MSEIKALEKLRKSSHIDDDKWMLENGEVVYIYNGLSNDSNAVNFGEQWRKIADEIEAEIAERFIELPVDEEGDVLRIGDELKCQGESILLNSVSWDGRRWYATETVVSSGWYPVHLCRHVKPRTLEDVLREFTDEVIEWSGYSGPVSGDRTWSGMAAKYVDEIREIMGCEE